MFDAMREAFGMRSETFIDGENQIDSHIANGMGRDAPAAIVRFLAEPA